MVFKVCSFNVTTGHNHFDEMLSNGGDFMMIMVDVMMEPLKKFFKSGRMYG